MQSFSAALLAAYRRNPCEVLPNALHKTLAELDAYRCDYALLHSQPARLVMQREDALLLYWDVRRRPPDIKPQAWAKMCQALLHADFMPYVPLDSFPNRTAFFRLIHRGGVSHVTLPPQFAFCDVHPATEAVAIADFLAQCYTDLASQAEQVVAWTRAPVHAADGWFWIVDVTHQAPAALAIVDVDLEVPEASLEWIQVHPRYRRRGLGQALVYEALARFQDRVAFTTVSGKVAARAPESLYRHCGFQGDDVWWVLR